jgi:hypothetical protein
VGHCKASDISPRVQGTLGMAHRYKTGDPGRPHEAEHVKTIRMIGPFEATQRVPGMSDRVSRRVNT